MNNEKNDNPILFIDIEACQEKVKDSNTNQYIVKHRLLQLGAIKYQSNNIEFFNEYALYTKPLSPKIKFLINKDTGFFKKQKYKEDEIYKMFLNFMNDSECYCFGDYDQIVLDDVLKNNNLNVNRIKLIDFANIFKKMYHIEKNLTPSLKNLCHIYNIEQRNDHNAKSDAYTLYKVCRKYINGIKRKIDYKKVLMDEFLRPKDERLHANYFKGKIVYPFVNEDYNIIFDKTNIRCNKTIEEKNGKHINVIVSYDINVNIVIRKQNYLEVKEYNFNKNVKTKQEAHDFLIDFYDANILDTLSNSVVFYDTASEYINKAYKKRTKNLMFYNYVVKNKIEAHFRYNNLTFETPKDKDIYLINFIKKFYDVNTKRFSKFIRYNESNFPNNNK